MCRGFGSMRLLNFFKDLFASKNEELTKKVKRHISGYLNYWGDEPQYRVIDTIYDIKVSKYSRVCEIAIYTNSPGILIGKGGENIDALKKYLNRQLSTEVTIYLKENQLWKNLN
jgi:ribosomal protein S3